MKRISRESKERLLKYYHGEKSIEISQISLSIGGAREVEAKYLVIELIEFVSAALDLVTRLCVSEAFLDAVSSIFRHSSRSDSGVWFFTLINTSPLSVFVCPFTTDSQRKAFVEIREMMRYASIFSRKHNFLGADTGNEVFFFSARSPTRRRLE